MTHNKKLIEEIASEVSIEFQMGEPFAKVHEDFLTEVATRYYEKLMGVPTIQDAEEYWKSKGFTNVFCYTIHEKRNLSFDVTELLTEFAEQANRKRIEQALKANAELMELIEQKKG